MMSLWDLRVRTTWADNDAEVQVDASGGLYSANNLASLN
ncbi:hypothetical protein M7I_1954 [Glarea lozoyensis 74030]|uniref:Uncharacterized protein n=1 Tax=Glarea lozoyensis (strain ATCC 74030 / MF5533) TaxID=1104152 RepID=H0EHH5_GLAL7|nr:hypothetical protein M7I_1954 [Glarea lozoyensis 74030]